MRLYPGKYYTQFTDETLAQALEAHSGGFDSIEDAIKEANFEPNKVEFYVRDWNMKIVHKGTTIGEGTSA